MDKKKLALIGASLGLIFLSMNKKEDKPLGALVKKNPKRKNTMLRHIQAQIKANETGKKQYLKFGDKTISVSPLVRK